MTTPVRAALYLWVSTGRQADNDLSIPDQRRQTKDYCAPRGWEIVAHYVEPRRLGHRRPAARIPAHDRRRYDQAAGVRGHPGPQARKRMRTESGGYRRDHLRALAQRVEVDAKEVRIMGSKSALLRTLSQPQAQKRRILACPVLYPSGTPARLPARPISPPGATP
jgi:hypothetical protein